MTFSTKFKQVRNKSGLQTNMTMMSPTEKMEAFQRFITLHQYSKPKKKDSDSSFSTESDASHVSGVAEDTQKGRHVTLMFPKSGFKGVRNSKLIPLNPSEPINEIEEHEVQLEENSEHEELAIPIKRKIDPKFKVFLHSPVQGNHPRIKRQI
jgi:hypothetical protein